jgi:hypothetical protein
VDRTIHDLNPAEVRSNIVAEKLVMISRDVDQPNAFSYLAEELLNDVVMLLRPVPTGLEPPAVDDVADKVDRIGVDGPKKIKQQVALTTLRAEVQIGDEECAVPPDGAQQRRALTKPTPMTYPVYVAIL